MGEDGTFRRPVLLDGESHVPKHRVRCPIHGFIRYSTAERHVIDHWLFRRLRYIRQLALTELVYPGATHTRFEHSLGVMETATRVFDRLLAENGAVMEITFRDVPVFAEDTLARARRCVDWPHCSTTSAIPVSRMPLSPCFTKVVITNR